MRHTVERAVARDAQVAHAARIAPQARVARERRRCPLLGDPALGARAICEPASDPRPTALAFPYAVALALPLAGVVLAIVSFADGDRDDGAAAAGATPLGCALYALLLTG